MESASSQNEPLSTSCLRNIEEDLQSPNAKREESWLEHKWDRRREGETKGEGERGRGRERERERAGEEEGERGKGTDRVLARTQEG